MNLPHDLKNYKAPLGAFQLLTPDQCVLIICFLAFIVGVWI